MKHFVRVEPTIRQEVGQRYKRETVIKTYLDEDGNTHEFTTWGREDGHSSAIVAITSDNQVIITYQFRAGPGKWLHELPGGGVNKDEDPQVAALRELAEETGYQAGNIMLLGVTGCRDAYINGTWHYYLATHCTPLLEGIKQDEEERLQGAEVKLITIDELIHNAKTGEMTDPLAVLMAYDQLMNMKEDIKNAETKTH